MCAQVNQRVNLNLGIKDRTPLYAEEKNYQEHSGTLGWVVQYTWSPSTARNSTVEAHY